MSFLGFLYNHIYFRGNFIKSTENLIIQIKQTIENFIKRDKKQYIQKLLVWTDKKIKINFEDNITSVVFEKYWIY